MHPHSLFDLDTGDGLALAVEALFVHMNTSKGAKELTVKFEPIKRSSRQSGGEAFSPPGSIMGYRLLRV